MSADTEVERDEIVRFIRKQAEAERAVANDYKIKRIDGEARVHAKIAEALGRVANLIERQEHVE